MNVISKEALYEKIQRGDDFRLIMSLDRRAFEQMHIPGSLHFESMEEAAEQIDPGEEVIVYCSNPLCPVSIQAYRALQKLGFTNLYRYAGGLTEWQEAGYPLEGSQVSVS
jgi:rhodanese-related sulfurtransferase